MKSFAGFIPGHENDKVTGWISVRAWIVKSENRDQNPEIP
jgi:hypothetical protein